jgi:hypothetical protein
MNTSYIKAKYEKQLFLEKDHPVVEQLIKREQDWYKIHFLINLRPNV